MLEIIQISDLHYGTSDFQEDLMTNVIGYINEAKPDAVICTGDLSNNGRQGQFEGIVELLDRIEPPFFCVPGDSDAKNNGMLFFEDIVNPKRFRLVLDDKDTILLGLRSPKPDVREGEIGDEQLEWIIDSLETHRYENRVLALHHHLIQVPDAGQQRDVVSDAGDMLALTQMYDIDLVLCGHRHVPHAWVIGPTTFLYCGTTATRRLRADEDPCFNHIKLDQGDLVVDMVSSVSLTAEPLLVRKDGRIEFIRPRTYRIERLRRAPSV